MAQRTKQYDEEIQDVLADQEKGTNSPIISKDIIKLSSGVVLKRKAIPFMRIASIVSSFEYPEIPEIYDEAHDRVLKNPDHPAYKKQCEAVDEKRTLAAIDAITAMGTEISFVPDDVAKVEDTNWVEECELFGIKVRTDSALARYLAWIKYVAILNEEDMSTVLRIYTDQMGTSERLVSQQASSFRN